MRGKGSRWIFLGLLLIAAALFLTAHNLWEEQQAQLSAQQAVERLEVVLPSPEPISTAQLPPEEMEIPDYLLDPGMDMPTEEIDGMGYVGLLQIPALDLELPVIDQWSYPTLKLAPCRYSGSAYLDDLVICAHNYKSHFGRLDRLHIGDTVLFTDMDGNVFSYEVAVLETLRPTAIEEMTAGDWPLSLFTCTLGGSYRVTIRCEKAN